MVVREKNCYYAIALTDFFVFLSCAEKFFIKSSIPLLKLYLMIAKRLIKILKIVPTLKRILYTYGVLIIIF